MPRLDHPALATFSDALLKLNAPNGGAFPERMLAALRALLPADINSYNEFGADRVLILLDPEPLPLALLDAFQAHRHEHANVRYLTETSDASAVKFSDFMPLHTWKRTGLYNEFFAPLGLLHQIGGTFPAARGTVVGFALNRTRRDFSEDERTMLNLLRPHLMDAWRNAQTRAEVERRAERVALISLDTMGQVLAMSPRAGTLLAKYFDHVPAKGLPEQLASWFRAQAEKAGVCGPELLAPCVFQCAGARLVARAEFGADGEGEILLEEKRTAPGAGALDALGLTNRESEVLLWLARGKANAEIAVILDCATRTVGKHLERVFEKLGVETRTAAAAVALEVLG